MTQETVIEVEIASVDYGDIENEALVVCRSCGHLVPKTMMCLYCGAPILFKKPRLEI
jgi:DNA-directed RNA polymerase subunit RPC12/RpoP